MIRHKVKYQQHLTCQKNNACWCHLASDLPCSTQSHCSCHTGASEKTLVLVWHIIRSVYTAVNSGLHKMLFSQSPYNQIKYCCSLKVNHFEDIPSQYCRVDIKRISDSHRDCKRNGLWFAILTCHREYGTAILFSHVLKPTHVIEMLENQLKFYGKAVIFSLPSLYLCVVEHWHQHQHNTIKHLAEIFP